MLPQFTLNARIIFFMMVMFATATTASLKKTNDVVIMLKNHERALHVNAGGKVTATDISLAQFFTMESVSDIFSDTFMIALYAKEVGRYLCFRRGKLVGMKNLTRDCHFIESLEHGYFLYANAYNPLWRVGFTRGLKPVGPRHWKRPQALKRACFLFVKINAEHFDRSRFTTTTTTTTTTAAPRIAAHRNNNSNNNNSHRASTVVTLREGYKSNDSKASIIDSNSNNHKKTKTANNGQRQNLKYIENVHNHGARQREGLRQQQQHQHQRHRKRKQQAKVLSQNNTGAMGNLQPKNLIRHHHDQSGNGEGRRRQHQREERERKLRLQNQRRQHHHEQQQDAENEEYYYDDGDHGEPMPNATNSASPSVTATTLAATASLAPSALNIVAMLAAGRRKRGRRKKLAETSNTNLSSNSGQQSAMDLQLVAQSPLQAHNQYDSVSKSAHKGHKLRHHHEHNYHQKQPTITPVNSTSSRPSTKEVEVQQQNHKYSNSNSYKDSQLFNTNSRSSSSRSHINLKSSSKNSNSNNLSHNYNLKRTNVNNNLNNLKRNNNDNINAIPALPKKHNLSKNILKQQTSTSSTDFKLKKHQQQQLSHSLTNEQPQINNNRSNYLSHISHDFQLPLTKVKGKETIDDRIDNNYDHTNDKIDYDDDVKNSNRLLVNNSNISDNNLQQEHLVNRFKLIYLDRIRSHNFNLKLNTKNKNHTKIQQHYNTNYNDDEVKENNSPISSTTTTTKTENHLILENFKQKSQISNDFSSEISNSKKTNQHSHRRFKRNIMITNNKNNNMNYHKNNENINVNNSNNISNGSHKKSQDNTNSNSSNSNSKIIKINSSNSGSKKSFSYDKNINVLKQFTDNNYNNVNSLNNLNAFTAATATTTSTTTTTVNAYLNSKLLSRILAQQRQEENIIKLINTPNIYDYNNYNDKDYDDDNDENFKRIQNKYEKIIVQTKKKQI